MDDPVLAEMWVIHGPLDIIASMTAENYLEFRARHSNNSDSIVEMIR